MQTANSEIGQFLDSICAKIPNRDKAEELRMEILDHIECKIEFFVGCGHSFEAAVEKSIEEMGDCKHVAEQLGEIHSRIPHFDLKNALVRISIGLLIQFFSIDIGFLQGLMGLVGVVLVLSGLLQIRKINSSLRAAFLSSCAQVAYHAAVFFITIAPIFHINEEAELVIGLISGIVQVIMLSLLGRGLAFAVTSASGGYVIPEFANIELKIKRIGFLYFIMLIVAWIGSVDQGASSIMVIPFVILSIMILSRILKTMRFLLVSQFGTGVADIPVKVWYALVFACVGMIILPFVASIALYSLPLSFSQEAAVDADSQLQRAAEIIGQDEVDKITAVFQENEVNMELYQSLPADEIVRLEDLVEIYSLIQSVYVKDGIMENHSIICLKSDGTAEHIFAYTWIEAPKRSSWDSIKLPRGNYFYSDSESNSRVFILSADESGTVRNQKPIRTRLGSHIFSVDDSNLYREIDSIDYRVDNRNNNQRVLICSSVESWLASNIQRLYLTEQNMTDNSSTASSNQQSMGTHDVDDFSLLGTNFITTSHYFPGCVYVSRDKFKPHSYSDSLNINQYMPVHWSERFGYTQSYVTSVLEMIASNDVS